MVLGGKVKQGWFWLWVDRVDQGGWAVVILGLGREWAGVCRLDWFWIWLLTKQRVRLVLIIQKDQKCNLGKV